MLQTLLRQYIDDLHSSAAADVPCIPCCARYIDPSENLGFHMQVDATDFSETATIGLEGRCVLDLCVDAADTFIGIVSVEPSHQFMPSSARVYEVGRQRVQVWHFPGRASGCRAPVQLLEMQS